MRARTSWLEQSAVCLDCRRTAVRGASCPGGDHRVVALDSEVGREALLQEVWGPRPLRDRIRTAAKSGGGSGLAGSLLEGCGGSFDCAGAAGGLDSLLVGLAIAAIVFVLVLLFGWAIPAIRARRARPRPRVARNQPRFGPRTGRTGWVVAMPTSPPAPVPLGDLAGVAFDTTFTARTSLWRRGAVLRDGATLGFEVALDDGGRIRIPPGAIAIDAPRAKLRPKPEQLDRYLSRLDPLRQTACDLDPFQVDTRCPRLDLRGPEALEADP